VPNACTWSETEPRRFISDTETLAGFAPNLQWLPDRQAWTGELPVWPFRRPQPLGLDDLLTRGLVVMVAPPPVYPIVAPVLYPITPDPPIAVRTQQRWHVAGDGRLCLMKSPGQWDPREPLTNLLLRAIGWHVEYALMVRGLIPTMTVNSIIDDDQLDALVESAVNAPVLAYEDLAKLTADSDVS